MSTEAPSLRKNPLDSVRCHSKSDIGQKREENQDSFGSSITDRYKFYFVCDGMGGVKGGAVASQLAVSVIENACKSLGALSVEAIRAAVSDANSSIFDRGTADEQLSGMGTTFVGIAFIGTKMLITSVGDSRAYRVRHGEIHQLTEDHTLVMELLRSGSITEEQAVNHPVSHMLTRSLGPAPEIEIDCWESADAPLPGDRYLLCSDGLYNMLGVEELSEVIMSLPPEEAVEELISLANLRGGHDNITVMLITIDDTYPEAPVASASDMRMRGPDSSISDVTDNNGMRAKTESQKTDNSENPKESNSGFTMSGEPSVTRNKAVHSQALRLRNSVGRRAKKSDSSESGAGTNAAKSGSQGPPTKGVEQSVDNRGSENKTSVSERNQSTASSAAIPSAGARTLSQARYLIIALSGLAAAYLLGHLHGASDEEQQQTIALHQRNIRTYSTENNRIPSNTFASAHQPIAVAPVAIQSEDSAPITSEENIEPSNTTSTNDASADMGSSIPTSVRLDHQEEDRKAELQRTILDLTQRLDAFRSPLSGKAGEMLKGASSQIERISRDLDSTRGQIDAATRALTIWLGRKKRLQTGDPINLASEVSVSAENVKTKQEAFNKATWSFLQESEVLRFNPGDKAQERKVADLARLRLASMREVFDSVKMAIDDELSKSEKTIETLTLNRVDLEAQLEQSRRDVEYIKALAGSDPRAREAKQLELQRLLDVAKAELDELARGNR